MAGSQAIALFGGAIICDIPSRFTDVPDTQELWIERDGSTSIIFDITERVGEPGSGPEIDGRALTAHFEEVVGSDSSSARIWNTAETEFTTLNASARTRFPAYTLMATQKPEGPDRGMRNDFTAILMTLLRLENRSTDILVTINVPHIKGEYDENEVDLELGKQGKLVGAAVEALAMIWETFDIKDWNLFVDA
ncbi:putative ran guanine nucleotide release factor [Escovopsis weberi]|uniref:Putative ran guanine nucleotide release factor n=1 Tax=Escovopsis weberi TaxID=150374 RepID=A0A0M9VXM8_ESCWE|nr:putative ran guanine nucleotide release factor [Escovopsis weberi]